jgi:DsbC/DsbD-like thiol-disulfide interchange protein/MFS family permease
MRFFLSFLLFFTWTVAAAPVKTPQAEAELVAERDALVPGEPISIALRLKAIPGWHTYWRNPGDSGEPTRIEWQLPAGFTAGGIEWPVPVRIPVGPLMNYGYKGEVLLLTRLVPPAELPAGKPATLRAKAYWLVCEVQCLQQDAELSLTLPVAGSAAPDPRWGKPIAATRAALPVPAPAQWAFGAKAEESGASLAIAPPPGVELKQAYFLPFDEGKIEPAAPQALAREGDGYRLALRAAAQQVGAFERLNGILILEKESLVIDVPVAARFADLGLVAALALAFAGGLLLNLMPCVLPVLSIKVLGFATGDNARLYHGLLYSVGVLVSFWALAALLIGLRALGNQLGWGFQLQSPVAVALLAAFFLGLALNLSGLLEFRMSFAGGPSGHFLSGVLAVVIASPCTAPFMGAALGYAVFESGWRAFAVFTALGLGMALPYAALAAAPGWRRYLPKPGPWMPRLKRWLALPLYGTVLWLAWVFFQQTVTPSVPDAGWEPYSAQRVAALTEAGKPVFVDFTAAWCVTCQVNERVVLGRDDVLAAFRQRGVTLVRADWTRRDPEIAQALAALGRSGVPAYVYYKPGAAPVLLPELLTRERVLAVLDG